MSVKTCVLGFPRIGKNRELKKACEAFWADKISREELLETASKIRKENWQRMKDLGIELIPSNDFSFYDHILDLTLALGAIPERYKNLMDDKLALYFAMAHGQQKNGVDVTAMEMSKWFDTNYHYIVPEFVKNQKFELFNEKAVDEFNEAKKLGIETKPVLVGPVSYLLLGKEKADGFSKLDLLDALLPPYIALLKKLEAAGAKYIQLDEPFLALDISDAAKNAFTVAYEKIKKEVKAKIIIATYFEGLRDNTGLALSLPCDTIHVDLVRASGQLDEILSKIPSDKCLSLGIIDGRNIWKNDITESLAIVKKAIETLGEDRVVISTSCSLLHVPYDLESETNENVLTPEIKRWLSFAWQKVEELSLLKALTNNPDEKAKEKFEQNKKDLADKKVSPLIHNKNVKERVSKITPADSQRNSPYSERRTVQEKVLRLPKFPTTTIGSFPQTKEVRSWRAKFKKNEISAQEYERLLKEETAKCVKWQEEIDLDVLVHGEFERNDMVEYFGEQLAGFTFTQNGWVQSYGSRCVKPPVIFGDVSRPKPMTVDWSVYAQSLTQRPMKGMLTGPVTILKWSFVRNDQSLKETCQQIALAIRDEVCDLEKNGIKVIQIDEPAIREALPLRRADWNEYLEWAVESFRISQSGVKDETQIHTHMCYSEFNDIIKSIADMDADVITIECSRSQMELLDVFGEFKYPNEIGPGVYDIHSSRVPTKDEILFLLKKAEKVIPSERLWVNPDCGLKTRAWPETEASLTVMVEAAKELRNE